MDIDFFETGEFTMKSDIWSFGIILWEILSLGREPYAGASANVTFDEIKAGFRLPCPEEIQNVDWLVNLYKESTQKCWQLDLDLRWTFADFVKYFENILTMNEKTKYVKLQNEYFAIQNQMNNETILSKRRDSLENQTNSDVLRNEIIHMQPLQHNGYHKFHSSENNAEGTNENQTEENPETHRAISVEVNPDSNGYHRVQGVLFA